MPHFQEYTKRSTGSVVQEYRVIFRTAKIAAYIILLVESSVFTIVISLKSQLPSLTPLVQLV
jgi:hypothetical protein